MNDIEDILDSTTLQENITQPQIKYRSKALNGNNFNVTIDLESFLPEKYKVFIQTWGCSHNSSDSEYMAGLLAKIGFQVSLNGSCSDSNNCVSNGKYTKFSKMQADLWILNSCTVKNPAEDHFRNLIKEAQINDKKLVVAGCVPQGQPKAEYLKGVSVVGVHQIDRVVEVVEETLKGGSVRLFAKKREAGKRLGGAPLDLPKIRKNPRIEILPVNTGCLNACTYCKTKHARGELGSYPPQEILDRVDQSFKEGVKEIWLTSEDLGAYGLDIQTNIAELLEQMVEKIPKGCMLRLGMTNPPYILSHLKRISKILAHPRVYSFLHVPVQSGSDNVLGEMRREYTCEEFCKVVDTIYEELGGPDNVTIATDIICGFPTETDKDFQETKLLVEKYKFRCLFTNQFFARPGTPAAKMERVASTAEVKQRTKQIHDLFQSYEPYTNRIGRVMNVLVNETSTDSKHLVGHTKAYEQVLLPLLTNELMGRVVQVKVTGSTKHSMFGELVRDRNGNIKYEDDVVSSYDNNSYIETSRDLFHNFIQRYKSADDSILRAVIGVLFVAILVRIIMVCLN